MLVLEPVAEAGLRLLADAGLEIVLMSELKETARRDALARASGVIVRSGSRIDRGFLDQAPKLRAIGRAGVGLDNVDTEEATARGIAVLNTPGGNAIAAAEHTMALLLALARHVAPAHLSLAKGEWDRQRFVGLELAGRTLGVVGLGKVGILVAKRAAAFEMTVLGHDPYLSSERARAVGVEKVELDELFMRSDVVTLHLPLTEKTGCLVDERRLRQMRPGGLLLNCARGGLVDETALLRALESGRLAGAGLDVFTQEPPLDSPLVGHAKVVHTPHLGASTKEAAENVSVQIARGMVDVLVHEDFAPAVNLPFASFGLAEIRPWLDLARRTGRLQGHLLEGPPERVEILVAEAGAQTPDAPLAAAFLSGLIEQICGREVNAINALRKAAELGIALSSGHTSTEHGFTRLLKTRVDHAGQSHRVDATLLADEEPRIVKLDGYWLDLDPAGDWLLLENEDVPGVVGNVGTLLGQRGINIGELRLGRAHGESTSRAISVWQVDGPVSDDVVGQLEDVPRIYGVRQLRLGPSRRRNR